MRWIFSILPPNISIGRRMAMLSSSTQPASRCSRFDAPAPRRRISSIIAEQHRAAGRAVLQLLARAEQHDACRFVFVLAKARNELGQAEGKQTPVEIARRSRRDWAVRQRRTPACRRVRRRSSYSGGMTKLSASAMELNSASVKGTKPQLSRQPSLKSSDISCVSPCLHAGHVDLANFQPVFHSLAVRDAGRLAEQSLRATDRSDRR